MEYSLFSIALLAHFIYQAICQQFWRWQPSLFSQGCFKWNWFLYLKASSYQKGCFCSLYSNASFKSFFFYINGSHLGFGSHIGFVCKETIDEFDGYVPSYHSIKNYVFSRSVTIIPLSCPTTYLFLVDKLGVVYHITPVRTKLAQKHILISFLFWKTMLDLLYPKKWGKRTGKQKSYEQFCKNNHKIELQK